jgi:hypothetical protein
LNEGVGIEAHPRTGGEHTARGGGESNADRFHDERPFDDVIDGRARARAPCLIPRTHANERAAAVSSGQTPKEKAPDRQALF